MPYIDMSRRAAICFDNATLETPGELNYQISSLINIYLKGGLSYADINEVIGVLECAKLELYRRVAAPYEDKKCLENGDVYARSITGKADQFGRTPAKEA